LQDGLSERLLNYMKPLTIDKDKRKRTGGLMIDYTIYYFFSSFIA